MPTDELLKQAKKLRPGDHLVALYQSENEIADYVSTYIHSALLRNERCIYITDDFDTSLVLEKLHALTNSLKKDEDLRILTKAETYSKNGKFNPDKLITMIKKLANEAIADGYSGLAITGEISWVLDYEDGERLIIEYEWKLNEYIFNTYPVSALCRYNINKFSDEMIKNIIQLHPIIVWRNRIHENPYYIPPLGFKDNVIAKYQVETWLENIYSFTSTKDRFRVIIENNEEQIRQLHKDMTNGVMVALLKILETHDTYTKDHCNNVSALALRLADSINATEEFKAKLYYAALVHDIGKTLIPKEILNKPSKLTEEEFDQIKTHPIIGANALSEIKEMHEIEQAILHHHERFDGFGYPDNLKGEDIPLMSRIISICDSYDAMINERPYRKAQTHSYAINEIIMCANKQYDGFLVDHFVSLFAIS